MEGILMEPDSPKQPNKVLIGIIVVVLLVAITAAVLMLSGKKEETPTSTTPQDTSSTDKTDSAPSTDTAPTASTGAYKDGSYQATGTYQTPGGTERVTVKVTLASGVIKSVDLERSPTTPEAQEYQGKFVSGYKAEVVGKNIDDVKLSRVAGSSLTSGGFNKALDTIKSDARS
jgi:uncharacterized protein with FMN-binding domain